MCEREEDGEATTEGRGRPCGAERNKTKKGSIKMDSVVSLARVNNGRKTPKILKKGAQ